MISSKEVMRKGEGRRRSWGGMQLNIKEESDEFILPTKEALRQEGTARKDYIKQLKKDLRIEAFEKPRLISLRTNTSKDLNALVEDLMELKPTLFAGIKARLGGRVRLIISGGAPLSSEVEEFLRVTFCAFVVTGYDVHAWYCWYTAVYNELRLEEVPEMGYNPLGEPPCGEICVRGKSVFSEYHKNPELTRESVKDGWFHTGDIGEILPNGVIKIIDRKKNLIKLSQGEYVALEYLENVYGITPIVEDIWVYGNSFKSKLVAVVVPHEENTKKWAYSNGHMGSFSELCSLDQLKNYVLSELKSTAERNKLRGFEYIKGVILEPHLFDMERDLITATMKKKRNKLLKLYQAQIGEHWVNVELVNGAIVVNLGHIMEDSYGVQNLKPNGFKLQGGNQSRGLWLIDA
uniref:Uncharacterized protein n=1 Tax=Fagus sylvatica TaxID=28930 RepID=A0A2N9IMV1_FAGSY